MRSCACPTCTLNCPRQVFHFSLARGVFPPDQILKVKLQTSAWISKLHQEGWNVRTFSMAEHIWALLKSDPLWPLCVMEDKSAPMNWARTNKALADILTTDNALPKSLESALEKLEGKQNALLLV